MDHRPPSPVSSAASMRSDWSEDEPPDLRSERPRPSSPVFSAVSIRSGWSKDEPPDLQREIPGIILPLVAPHLMRSFAIQGRQSSHFENHWYRPPSPLSSAASMRSDWSKDEPPDLRSERPRPPSPVSSAVSMRSDWSKDEPPDLQSESPRPSSPVFSTVSIRSDWSKDEPPDLQRERPRPPSSVFSAASMRSGWSKEITAYLRSERPRPPSPVSSAVSMRSGWSKDEPLDLQSERPSSPELQTSPPKLKDPFANDDFLKFSPDNSKGRLVLEVKKRVLERYEKELHKLGIDSELFEKSENKVVQTYNDVFIKSKKGVRTVLTKGVAGIGKTLQTKRMMADWATGHSNKDIDFILPLSLRELKKRGDEERSLEDLLSPSLYGDKQGRNKVDISECNLAIILDDFEELKSPLDFEKNRVIDDVKTPASLDVLLTNLIKGTLLPSACLWIITQPSGADKIPVQHIDRVTECRETVERRKQLVSNLKRRFVNEYNQVEDPNHENQKNTEHILREHCAEETSEDGQTSRKAKAKTVTPVKVAEIFKPKQDEKLRTVLTVGEANVGKTFHVRKFVKEWAKNQNQSLISLVKTFFSRKTEKDVEVIFPIDLSKYEFAMKTRVSLVELLNELFEETKKSVISDYSKFNLTFILDGLDSFQLPLEFDNQDNKLSDVREPATMNVLLTNLIRGDLLPSAHVWITSRSSAAQKLPADCVDKKTEIREKPDITSKKRLKIELKEQLTYVSQGIDRDATSALLNEIYTDLYIIEGERGEVNTQNEGKQILDARSVKEEKPIRYCDIFKNPSDRNIYTSASVKNAPIKTVLTVGMAGIGKTFASMKYMLDWAETPLGEDVDYMFPLPFRELNLRKDHEHSLEELINQFFPAMETSEITDYNQYKFLIVLDGFDECCLDLNFDDSTRWTDVTEPTSVDVLVTNLIQGNLLPKAQIWITSRPAASNKIPYKNISRVTEVRGFNDEQKEEYFRKRFRNKELAEKVLSDVKKSRSLFIMCYIPVFCWITSKVMEDIVTHRPEAATPKTLTDMYIHFLLLQCKQANAKYNETEASQSSEADPCWNERNKETVLSLGKLAFEELEKGNLIFTEDQLDELGINITNAAVFSGLFTQIKRESSGLYPQKLFCFVHLSIQEFLAALHATYTFTNNGENVFTEAKLDPESPASDFYKKAVDKALESKHGDWDMFLRFLLGLCLETNQNLLQELLKKAEKEEDITKTYQETVEHVKKKIREDVSDPEKNLNLFHCLNELNDNTLVEEVKKSLQSETKSFESYSPSQWSALTYVLLTSDENLDVFDLKKYLKSEKVLLGMLPVVKVSETTLLSWCNLTEESCIGLTTSVLSSASSNLTVLDLSHNDLLDAGIERLAEGLQSVHCKLKTLKLSWCNLTEESCIGLKTSVLSSASSNLTVLDLSHNDLLDAGIERLAEGLQSVHCKLKTLKLAGCQVTEKGCSALASALKNRTTPLEVLDLSYNNPGGRGLTELEEIFAHPNMELCVDYAGEHRLKPGLKKYDGLLKFDEHTAGQRLILLDGNRTVKTLTSVKERVARSNDEERFKRTQVLCEEGLKGLCYWEVEWTGTLGIAVAYNEVGRTWNADGGLGCNDKSWSLMCSETGFMGRDGRTFIGFKAIHGKHKKYIEAPCCQKIAVFLDWEGGTLSYYSVSAGELSLIHTFRAKFTGPVYPGFWFKKGSVTLCDIVCNDDANCQQ